MPCRIGIDGAARPGKTARVWPRVVRSDQLRNGRWVEWSMCSAMVLRACSVTDQHVSPRTSRIVKLSLLCRRCLPYHRWRRRCPEFDRGATRDVPLGRAAEFGRYVGPKAHKTSIQGMQVQSPSFGGRHIDNLSMQQTPVKWHGSCKWRTT